jgi:hypothetical protein
MPCGAEALEHRERAQAWVSLRVGLHRALTERVVAARVGAGGAVGARRHARREREDARVLQVVFADDRAIAAVHGVRARQALADEAARAAALGDALLHERVARVEARVGPADHRRVERVGGELVVAAQAEREIRLEVRVAPGDRLPRHTDDASDEHHRGVAPRAGLALAVEERVAHAFAAAHAQIELGRVDRFGRERVHVARGRVQKVDAVALLLLEAAQVHWVFGHRVALARAAVVGRRRAALEHAAPEARGAATIVWIDRAGRRAPVEGPRVEREEALPFDGDRAVVLVAQQEHGDERVGPQEGAALLEQRFVDTLFANAPAFAHEAVVRGRVDEETLHRFERHLVTAAVLAHADDQLPQARDELVAASNAASFAFRVPREVTAVLVRGHLLPARPAPEQVRAIVRVLRRLGGAVALRGAQRAEVRADDTDVHVGDRSEGSLGARRAVVERARWLRRRGHACEVDAARVEQAVDQIRQRVREHLLFVGHGARAVDDEQDVELRHGAERDAFDDGAGGARRGAFERPVEAARGRERDARRSEERERERWNAAMKRGAHAGCPPERASARSPRGARRIRVHASDRRDSGVGPNTLQRACRGIVALRAERMPRRATRRSGRGASDLREVARRCRDSQLRWLARAATRVACAAS